MKIFNFTPTWFDTLVCFFKGHVWGEHEIGWSNDSLNKCLARPWPYRRCKRCWQVRDIVKDEKIGV